jgi:putative SOS response-associated peptidase YedK
MCGRFAQFRETRQLAELLAAAIFTPMPPRYNVSPSQPILACKLGPMGERVLEPMHWGLIPSWAESAHTKYSLINARAETVAEKPAFRHAFRHRRCLIPADGFYEWRPADGKQPYYIHRRDDSPLVFAGLWEHWDGPEGECIDSCTIIVTDANAQLEALHPRMPLILPPSQWGDWLSPATPAATLGAMLAPYTGNDLTWHAVSRRVNNPRNEDASLIRAVRG